MIITIHLTTERPYPLMPVDMAAGADHLRPAWAPMSARPTSTRARRPSGTGPYRFVEWVPGDRLVIERNEDYFDAKPEWETDRLQADQVGPGPRRRAARG